ncbi:MAG: hypothetical protein QG599_2518 [Pseudomonadota bacterium]|nr:hypothetical protein [Pseudomonadota bacterium]
MGKQADYRYLLQEAIATLADRAQRINQTTVYDQGRAMAYYEIFSQLASLANETGIDPKEIGLEDMGDLVGMKKAA